jgi:magnesium transporter
VAVLTPWGIHKMGGDPAFASGPVATVVLDILSVTVYLLIASAVVR